MAIALTLQQFLDDKHVDYEVLAHRATSSAVDSALSAHVASASLAKAVLLAGDGDFVLAVIPANERVDLRNIRRHLGRSMTLADEAQASMLFRDCAFGAIPPVGKPYDIEVIMDDALAGKNDIYFEGGDHCSLVHLKGSQFAHLMAGAGHGDIARPQR